MKYMGDHEFWDEKFKNRDNQIMKPEESLVQAVSLFKKGTVLDVACGDGRNSLYLLAKGFQVTGVDFSHEALKRLNHFAKNQQNEVVTIQLDLSDSKWIEQIGIFDNIVICHYRVCAAQLSKMHEHINKGGILFVTGFGPNHKVDQRISATDLIMPNDFEGLEKDFEKIMYQEFEDTRGSFVTYIFRRK